MNIIHEIQFTAQRRHLRFPLRENSKVSRNELSYSSKNIPCNVNTLLVTDSMWLIAILVTNTVLVLVSNRVPILVTTIIFLNIILLTLHGYIIAMVAWACLINHKHWNLRRYSNIQIIRNIRRFIIYKQKFRLIVGIVYLEYFYLYTVSRSTANIFISGSSYVEIRMFSTILTVYSWNFYDNSNLGDNLFKYKTFFVWHSAPTRDCVAALGTKSITKISKHFRWH